jgi:hypothetical protein
MKKYFNICTNDHPNLKEIDFCSKSIDEITAILAKNEQNNTLKIIEAHKNIKEGWFEFYVQMEKAEAKKFEITIKGPNTNIYKEVVLSEDMSKSVFEIQKELLEIALKIKNDFK